MSEKIKPCPLCGGEGKIHKGINSTEVGWEDGLGSPGTMHHFYTEVYCNDCGVTFSSGLALKSSGQEESAIEKWNKAKRGESDTPLTGEE